MRVLREDFVTVPLTRRYSSRQRSFAEGMARHAAAIAASLPAYTDSVTGNTVFTAAFLADRGYCCESGCRHCPYDLAAR